MTAIPDYKTGTVSGVRGQPAVPVKQPVPAASQPPGGNPPGAVERIVRTSTGLREVLFDQLERLRNGQCTVNEAKAVAMLSKSIVDTVHMEIAVAEARDGATGIALLPPALKLDGPGK